MFSFSAESFRHRDWVRMSLGVSESLADFFESTLAGIRIAAKAGKARPALRRIAEVASGTFADVKQLKA